MIIKHLSRTNTLGGRQQCQSLSNLWTAVMIQHSFTSLPPSSHTSLFKGLLSFSLKTAKTEIIYDIIFKGRVCLKKTTWYLYEKFHQNPKMNGIGTTENHLKQPNEQTQVVPAVFLQLLRIPPGIIYGDVKRTGNGALAYVNTLLGTVHSRQRTL